MNQIFVTCRFNLRNASSTKPVPVYLVTYLCGKQYKVATGVKVLPFQWDKHRQMAIVSNIFSEIDNYNNSIVNERLAVMRDDFSNYLDYLCTHQENPTELFRQTFNKGMAKNENSTMSATDAIKIINAAFRTYYAEINPAAKESSQTQQKRNLQKFIEYVGTMEIVNIKELFSQRSINDFKGYMQQNGETASTINRCGGVVCTLVNKVIAVHNDFLKYKVNRVEWIKARDSRKKDDNNKHFPLYENEIQAIKDCQTLTEREQEFRVMFLLQCETGLRFGDLLAFMRREYIDHKDGYYFVKTEKNGKVAMIRDTDELSKLLSQVASFKCVEYKTLQKTFNCKFNIRLKTIAQKSGLNRVITGKDASGKEYAKPIHEIITSHCARYTFVRNMCISGVAKDKVILMTGHTDTKMINNVYLRYSKEDKANILNQEFAEIEQTANKESEPESKSIKDVVFAFNDILSVGNRYDLPVVQTIITKIKRIPKNINRCVSLYNDATESEKEQFAADINSLDHFYYELARIKNDADIYKQFQYKQKLFGLIDDVLTDDEISAMWQNDETEYYSIEASVKRFFETGDINQ